MTLFDGEMSFALLPFQLQPRDLDRDCGLYQSAGVAKLIHS